MCFGVTKEEATLSSLHVRFLPLDATAAEIAAFCSRFGPVRFMVFPERLVAQKSGASFTWRYASITFMDLHGANAAFIALENARQYRLRPDAKLMQASWSKGAFVPLAGMPEDVVWVAPELLRPARAAGGSGGDRARKRSRRRSRSRSRSRSRGRSRYDDRRRREASPRRRDVDRGHDAMPAPHPLNASHSTQQQQSTLPQPVTLPPPPSLPPAMPLAAALSAAPSMAQAMVPQVQYRSFMTCALFAVPAAPISVVGTPIYGDPALPRPLALDLHWRASHVEAMGSHLPPSRLSVVAMEGEDAASAAALRELAAQLAAPAAQPGGEAWAAGVFSADGAAHFFLPPSEAALRCIMAARPGAPPPPLTAAGITVSLLLTDAAVAAAENTRAAILAALQASRSAAVPPLHA